MYKLTLDRRLARKDLRPDEVFDLGAGLRNCIDCAARSGPKEDLGYCCATYVDAVTGAHLPAFEMRCDEAACGELAEGFSPVVGLKSCADPYCVPDYMAFPGGTHENPSTLDPRPPEDPVVTPTGEERACTWCAHSFKSHFDSHNSDIYCARAIFKETGLPLTVKNARCSEQLCGAFGEWFEEAPPMSDREADILAAGGSTFYHW